MTSTSLALAVTPTIDPTILRAYDIRGIYGKTVTEEVAYLVGRAFATIAARTHNTPHPVIVTARDGRLSSPSLGSSLLKGLQESGARVVNVGVGPSPLCYFAHQHVSAHAAIMLTGSHNPSAHNGFKMICGAKPFYGDDIAALGRLIEVQDFAQAAHPLPIEEQDLSGAYIARLLQGFNSQGAKPLKIVWDAGNGAAGDVMKQLTAQLAGEHILLNEQIDGTFPAHHPDPTVAKNLEQLIEAVKAHGADMGVAFDGDGDRIGALDSNGTILWGDQMMVLFAREILSRKAGATIIADVKASQTLFDDIAVHGGNPIMWKTGHSHIKSKMKETKAELAGEMSGHIFFADGYLGFDDGLYAAVRLANIVAHSDQTLSAMLATIPTTYSTPEIRVDCADTRKFAVVEEVRARLHARANAGEALAINEVDGVRVNVAEGWWLMRASNTQAALIVRCEAQHEAGLTSLVAMVEAELAKCGVDMHQAADH